MQYFIDGFVNTLVVIGRGIVALAVFGIAVLLFVVPVAVVLAADKYFKWWHRVLAVIWLVVYSGILGGIVNYYNKMQG